MLRIKAYSVSSLSFLVASLLGALAILSCQTAGTPASRQPEGQKEKASKAASSTTEKFALIAHFPTEGAAEIVAATPDGKQLIYTNSDTGTLGFVDITDPANPKSLGYVSVQVNNVGEPTSVAISPDGKYAVVVIRMGDDKDNPRPGLLRVYDLPAKRWVKDVQIGIGPDSIALDGEGRTLRAIVAIEDEETNSKGDATVPGVRPGAIEIVGLQDLYGAPSTGIQRIELVEALTKAGANYPQDPQPEYVSIHKTKKLAAVTLQENNAVAIVDLKDPKEAKLVGVYTLGTVVRSGNADMKNDKEIQLNMSFEGRREPDAVAWVGDYIALANEGDTDKDKGGIFGGSRGWSLHDMQGKVVFDPLALSEQQAVIYGHYPDKRSEKKGIEMEGVAFATFGGTPYLFVGSERGSFLEVWQVDDPKAPKWIQSLPTGVSPEGIAPITSRADGKGLVVTSNEVEGSLTIYQFYKEGAPIKDTEPQVRSTGHELPWSALSGLTTDGTTLFAVPDNAFGHSRIFHINPQTLQKGQLVIDKVTFLMDQGGNPVKVDPEGIAFIPGGGFWIASEGKKVAENELIRVNSAGVVQERVKLPESILSKFANPDISYGYEGVAISRDGRYLYVALQRGYDPKNKPNEAAILRYDTQTNTWISALYPLDTHSKDPATYWMGISEVTLLEDGRLLVLERDKGGSENGAIHAEIKRIYSVHTQDLADGTLLKKTLVKDLRKDFNYLQEKAEGMTVFKGHIWVVNDNDGAGWTRFLNVGKP